MIETKIINLAVPVVPLETTKVSTITMEDWIRFGNDNLFPSALANINRRSAVHRGILNFKSIYMMGKGFVSEQPDINEIIVNPNNSIDTLNDIFGRVLKDKLSLGNGYIEIVSNTRRGFIQFFHQDATKVRLHKDKKSILIHPDWSNVQNTKDKLIQIPLFPVFAYVQGSYRSIFHYKDYEPEYTHYGIPDWISGLEAAAIAYKTNKWNLSRLDNSFIPSGILVASGNLSPDEAKKLKEKISSEFIGEGRQGKLMVMIKELGSSEIGTEYTAIPQNLDSDWTKLHRQSTEDIIAAHNWFPTLSGVIIPDRLGSTNQIRMEYQIALNTVISDEQSRLIRVLKRIIEMTLNKNVDSLYINNESPVNVLDLLNLNRITKKWEGRKLAGLDYDETDEKQNEFIEDGNADNTSRNSNAGNK